MMPCVAHGDDPSSHGNDEINFKRVFKDLNKADHTWPIGNFEALKVLNDPNSSFIESLGIPIEYLQCYHHPALRGSETIALEMRGVEPIALYIDLYTSGSFTSNERLPSRPKRIDSMSACEFKTPGFEVKRRYGKDRTL